MAGIDNLKPAKPGEIRNPNGKPKGTLNRSTIVKRWLEARLDDDHLFVDAITKAVIEKAMGGDVAAFRELMDSSYGKVADKTELTGKDGGAIQTQDVSESDEAIIQRYMQGNNGNS